MLTENDPLDIGTMA